MLAGITRLLVERRAWFVKVHGSRYGRSGIPDLLICHRGRFIALEVKRPGRHHLDALQRVEMSRIERSHGVASKVQSVAEAAAILDEIERTTEISDLREAVL